MEQFIKQRGKVLALDLGTSWDGVAISDKGCLFARPLTTVRAQEIDRYLRQLFTEEEIETVVVGYPLTMRGTESEQTKLVIAEFNRLRTVFPDKEWKCWDERLTSKRAASLGSRKTAEERLREHARAAAAILDVYLAFLHATRNPAPSS